jgi:hypothetical protein
MSDDLSKFEALWDALVPLQGQAETVQGELVRALGCISNDYFSNGSSNWDKIYEKLSSLLLNQLCNQDLFEPSRIANIKHDISGFQNYGRGKDLGDFDYEAAFERLAAAVVAWCEKHPLPIPLSSVAVVAPTPKKVKKSTRKRGSAVSQEPTNETLGLLQNGVEVSLIDFDKTLTRLKPEDCLARYNRVRIRLKSNMEPPPSMVFLNVSRHGTSIGDDNFNTVPLHVPELAKFGDCVYDVFSFDAFNLSFESISVNLTTPKQLEQRCIGQAYIDRAHEHTHFVREQSAA